MRKNVTLCFCICILFAAKGVAQVKIGDYPTSINSNSLLELESTNKGLVPPRISIGSLSSAYPLNTNTLTGTIVFNTNAGIGTGKGIYYWDSTNVRWIAVTQASSSNYIQNTTSQQNLANFNISGSGTIGANLHIVGSSQLDGVLILGTPGSNIPPSIVFNSSTSGQTVSIIGGSSGTITYTLALPTTAPATGQVLYAAAGGASTTLGWTTPNAGTGTVTSFGAAALSPLFTTAITNPNTTPALSFALNSQTANTIFAAPTGIAGTPTFRSLTSADLPAGTGTVTSVGITMPTGFTVSNSPITSSGSLAVATTLNGLISGNGSGFSIASITSPLSFIANTLSIAQANLTTNGYLSSIDWSTFNNKQSALTFSNSLVNTGGSVSLVNDAATPGNSFYYGTNSAGTKGYFSLPITTVTGTGIANYISKWSNSSALTNSIIQDNGIGVGINSAPSTNTLDVNGTINTGKNAGNNGVIKLTSSTNGNAVTLQSGATATTYAMTLPTAQGIDNTYLKNDGAGALSWSSVIATTGQSVTIASSQTNTEFDGNNTGSYSNSSGRGWTIGTWQDVTGLSIIKTIATGHLPVISFSIDGYSNDYSFYAPSVAVFRIVRDGTVQLGKASVLSNEASYNYYYFNANFSILDNGFPPNGVTPHTWKIQYWMADSYTGSSNTESIFLEDRDIQLIDIAP